MVKKLNKTGYKTGPSKTFLDKQKKKLIKEKENIIQHVTDLKKDDPFSDPDYVNDNAAVDTEVREQNSHQIIEAEIHALENRINDIDKTLQKIEKGRYGNCAKCNRAIPQARLRLIPEAQYCIECEHLLKK